MVRFSQLIAEQRWIQELDINPLLASPGRLLALDARVVIYGPEISPNQLPKLAIRPYPTQYVNEWTARDGSPITFRPIRAEDEPMLVKFHQDLSDKSVYLRYMRPMLLNERVTHERLSRICHCDYNVEIALVAERNEPKTGEKQIIAVGRISKLHGKDEARFTVLVTDYCQGLGVGTELLHKLIQVAREEKLSRLEALITADNLPMQNMCKKLGFSLSPLPDGKLVKAEMELS